MIVISNQQRDEAVRYIDIMVDCLKGSKGLRAHNTVRMAKILKRKLLARPTIPASDLPQKVKNFKQ